MRPTETKITLDDEDMGTLCICALRYCMGRQSYMPSLVTGICAQLLTGMSDKTLHVMKNDCDFCFNYHMYGDESIDKPRWEWWRERVLEEIKRRETDKS